MLKNIQSFLEALSATSKSTHVAYGRYEFEVQQTKSRLIAFLKAFSAYKVDTKKENLQNYATSLNNLINYVYDNQNKLRLVVLGNKLENKLGNEQATEFLDILLDLNQGKDDEKLYKRSSFLKKLKKSPLGSNISNNEDHQVSTNVPTETPHLSFPLTKANLTSPNLSDDSKKLLSDMKIDMIKLINQGDLVYFKLSVKPENNPQVTMEFFDPNKSQSYGRSIVSTLMNYFIFLLDEEESLNIINSKNHSNLADLLRETCNNHQGLQKAERKMPEAFSLMLQKLETMLLVNLDKFKELEYVTVNNSNENVSNSNTFRPG